jgi:hypothetical protein
MSSPATPARVPPQGWSTPTILRVCLVSIWLTDAIFLGALISGARMHRDATKTVGRDTAPSIIAAQHIKSAMAGMDVTETEMLLTKPDQELASHYSKLRLDAMDSLIAAAENITYGDQERSPLRHLALGLSDYEELVQRANDLRSFKDPRFVAAYHAAAAVMDTRYAAADELDNANRTALNRIYESIQRTSIANRSGVIIAGIILLFVLLSVQNFLARRMRRVFNIPLVLATAIGVWLMFYSFVSFSQEMLQLKIAKQDAFESIDALWRARALAYIARADENRFLLDEPHAAQYDQAFFTKSKDVTEKYIDAELHNITFPGERDAANDTAKFFDDYLKADKEVRRLKQAGKRDAAITLCLGSDPGQAKWIFQQFDGALERTLEINQRAFDKAVLDGERTLQYFQTKAVVACLAIAILALVGLLSRIQEYR